MWCNELCIRDNKCVRFLRMMVHLVDAKAYELLEFMCSKKMWDIPAAEAMKVWETIFKSGFLEENVEAIKSAISLLGVTPDFVAFTRQMNRSTDIINTLVSCNPSICADATTIVDGEEKRSNKRTKVAKTD